MISWFWVDTFYWDTWTLWETWPWTSKVPKRTDPIPNLLGYGEGSLFKLSGKPSSPKPSELLSLRLMGYAMRLQSLSLEDFLEGQWPVIMCDFGLSIHCVGDGQ